MTRLIVLALSFALSLFSAVSPSSRRFKSPDSRLTAFVKEGRPGHTAIVYIQGRGRKSILRELNLGPGTHRRHAVISGRWTQNSRFLLLSVPSARSAPRPRWVYDRQTNEFVSLDDILGVQEIAATFHMTPPDTLVLKVTNCTGGEQPDRIVSLRLTQDIQGRNLYRCTDPVQSGSFELPVQTKRLPR